MIRIDFAFDVAARYGPALGLVFVTIAAIAGTIRARRRRYW